LRRCDPPDRPTHHASAARKAARFFHRRDFSMFGSSSPRIDPPLDDFAASTRTSHATAKAEGPFTRPNRGQPREALPSPRPKRGRPRSWTPSTVRSVLYRDLYRGISVWNKRRQTDALGQRKCERRPESEWIRAEVPHLRIVSEAQWAEAHRRLASSRRTYLKSCQNWAPWTGLSNSPLAI
jgi:hypothetical protein